MPTCFLLFATTPRPTAHPSPDRCPSIVVPRAPSLPVNFRPAVSDQVLLGFRRCFLSGVGLFSASRGNFGRSIWEKAVAKRGTAELNFARLILSRLISRLTSFLPAAVFIRYTSADQRESLSKFIYFRNEPSTAINSQFVGS